jgi:succinate dehydrogenase/fumarate reductase-like Fe-S protein
MAEVILDITRGTPQSGEKVFTYKVPYEDGMSLLDAVQWLREHEEPDLVVRFSCRSANACKECSATINGKVGYLCNTKAVPGTRVTLQPLATREWVRDLVTDLD